jgi:hypothetical protein
MQIRILNVLRFKFRQRDVLRGVFHCFIMPTQQQNNEQQPAYKYTLIRMHRWTMRASSIVKVSRRSLSRSSSLTTTCRSSSSSGGGKSDDRQRRAAGCTAATTSLPAAASASRTTIQAVMRLSKTKPIILPACGVTTAPRSLSSSTAQEQQELEDHNKSPASSSSSSAAAALPTASATPRKVLVGVSKEDEHKEETKRRRLSEVRRFSLKQQQRDFVSKFCL